MTKLSEIKQSVSGLTPNQLLKPDLWLHELLAAAESMKTDGAATGRQVLEKHATVNKTYQLGGVRRGRRTATALRGTCTAPTGTRIGLKGG